MFNKRNPNYQLCHNSHFSIPPVRSAYRGTKSLPFLGPKIWDMEPTELKKMKTLSAFKSGIKNCWQTVDAGYVSDICQILVLYNVGSYA